MLDTSPAAESANERSSLGRKKLIEVALPLDAINIAAKRETKTTNGHPSTFHQWWGHRPYSVARALVFSSLVDDPSSQPDRFPTVELQNAARGKLFDIIRNLVDWAESAKPGTIATARNAIAESIGRETVTVVDPFSGRGTIPFEARRLGCDVLAADISPVAVLVSKALVEIPAVFDVTEPVNTEATSFRVARTAASAIADDVKHYGEVLLDRVREKIGHAYGTAVDDAGNIREVIAWLWARSIKCPNPVCGAETPLMRSNVLSGKANKKQFLKPIVDLNARTVKFVVSTDPNDKGGNIIPKRSATCLFCMEPIPLPYIRAEGMKKAFGNHHLVGAVIDVNGKKQFVGSDQAPKPNVHADLTDPTFDVELTRNSRYMGPTVYGLARHRDLYTERQLMALTTFADEIAYVRTVVLEDARSAGMGKSEEPLERGGNGAVAYADAIATYLGIAVSRLADRCSTLAFWQADETAGHVFVRSALSMTWDFVEPNPIGTSTGSFLNTIKSVVATLVKIPNGGHSRVVQQDCRDLDYPNRCVIITDPPYYDNIPYSDISEYFYVWLRRGLESVWPQLLAPLSTPKANELTYSKGRFHGDEGAAREYVTEGFAETFRKWREIATDEFPMVVMYAFRATEDADEALSSEGQVISYGWESMLSSLIGSGFQITGTWPIGTERDNRFRSVDSNALGSSIALICRPRPLDAKARSRSQFVADLRLELPSAVQRMREASLAATDLQQAALGPGIAVFSRQAAVLEADDSPMTVRAALALINDELAQIILGEISDVDAETHFALAWFDRFGYSEGRYAEADTLLKFKNANLKRLEESGVLRAQHRGSVMLLAPRAIDFTASGSRISEAPAWAQVLILIAALVREDGSSQIAAEILRRIDPSLRARLKDLAYYGYITSDRQKRSSDALDFNTLVSAWPDLERQAAAQQEGRLL